MTDWVAGLKRSTITMAPWSISAVHTSLATSISTNIIGVYTSLRDDQFEGYGRIQYFETVTDLQYVEGDTVDINGVEFTIRTVENTHYGTYILTLEMDVA